MIISSNCEKKWHDLAVGVVKLSLIEKNNLNEIDCISEPPPESRIDKSSNNSVENPLKFPKNSKSLNEERPYTETQYDGLHHYAVYDAKKWSTRCKQTGCSGKTRFLKFHKE